MDAIDSKILRHLSENGRASWAELANEVGLSAPSTTERVRKLEAAGVIRSWAALVDARSVGYELLAFVAVQASSPTGHEEMFEWALRTEEVQECHVIAGANDYLLKIRCRGPADLERLLRQELRALPGVTRTDSTIVLETTKETPCVPIAVATEDAVP